MTRLRPYDPDALSPELRAFYDQAAPHERMMLTPTAHQPVLLTALHEYHKTMTEKGTLPNRLVELLRLRVAFHNQCRSCMAMRYQSALDDGLTEELVCSLEKPEEADDLTDAEKAALAYADISATNHFAITDQTFEDLRVHYSEPEIVELGLWVAYFIGFGRLMAAYDLTEDLPEGWDAQDALATPSSGGTFVWAS